MSNRKGMVLLLVGLSALIALGLGFGGIWAGHISFGEIDTDFITKYHEQPLDCDPKCLKQDLSGAATDGDVIIFADDGGAPSEFNKIRVTEELPDDEAVNLPLSLVHRDLEGATFWNGFFVVTTSLSKTALLAESPLRRRLTRFKVNEERTQLIAQQSVDLKGVLEPAPTLLMKALKEEFGAAWFNAIKDKGGEGGLNIEGLSTTGKADGNALLWGLRSPLFGPDFPANLRRGKAIIAEVERPFSNNPSFKFKTLDLLAPTPTDAASRHGIRGMEFIPAMKGFVIIGGPVKKDNDYSLWFWDGKDGLERLDLPDTEAGSLGNLFRKLCRPESVIEMKEKGDKFLVVFSEHSGDECNDNSANPVAPAEFTFIKAEIASGNN